LFPGIIVTVGCSNILGCCEVWCSPQGRPTNRLDTQTEWSPWARGEQLTVFSRDETMPSCWQTLLTRIHLYPDGWQRRVASFPPSHHQWNRSVTGTFSHPQKMWGREWESGSIVNNSIWNTA